MHGENLEFGNLIPRKLCFWREISAILSFKSIDISVFFLLKFQKKEENIQHFDANFDHIPAKLCIILSLGSHYSVILWHKVVFFLYSSTWSYHLVIPWAPRCTSSAAPTPSQVWWCVRPTPDCPAPDSLVSVCDNETSDACPFDCIRRGGKSERNNWLCAIICEV